MGGEISGFGRGGATRVEHGTAAPVDRARVLTSKLNDVMRPASRVIDVQMRSASQPRRRPKISMLFSLLRYVALLITALSPGTSPPPVSIPIRFTAMAYPFHLTSHRPFRDVWRCVRGHRRNKLNAKLRP